MKKLNGFLLLFILFLMQACNTSERSDGTYLLKMRLEKGDKFGQDLTMDMDITMIKMKMDVGVEFEVLDSTAAGKQLKMTYTNMNIHMDRGGAAGPVDDSALNKMNSRLLGKPVIITLADNKVTEVKGFETLTDSTDEAVRATMEKMFSKENINSMFGMMFNLYPDKPVKIGDSWSAFNNMDLSGMNMNVNTKYTLVSVKNNIAEIGIDGKIVSSGSVAADSSRSMEMEITGTQTGAMNIKLSDGYLKDGKYNMDINAVMNMMQQKMPIKMTAVCTVKGK